MAITLPTFEIVDQAKEDRLLNAFKPTPGASKAEAAAEYRKWLKAALLQEVRRRETQQIINRITAETPPALDLLD